MIPVDLRCGREKSSFIPEAADVIRRPNKTQSASRSSRERSRTPGRFVFLRHFGVALLLRDPGSIMKLFRIFHKEIRRIEITPILLRCGGDSGSVIYQHFAQEAGWLSHHLLAAP